MKNKLRTLLALALLAMAAHAQADVSWSNLWRNPDPRGKSYAEFKAGNYAAAAQDLAPFDDSEAHYNRGNALAFAGDLPGALKAYDAALKQDPNNRDAQHNRALVANALKQQQQQQQQQQPPKQDQKPGQQPDAKNNAQNGQQAGNGQSGGQQGGQQNKQMSDQKNVPQNNRQPDQAGQNNDGKSDAKSAPSQAAGKDASPAQPPANSQAQSGQPANQNSQTDPKNDAEQARRDIAAGAADANTNTAAANARPPAPRLPQNEQQIAQDQWLRGIPDDPGGLLRRKFLIEHMIRQQSAQP